MELEDGEDDVRAPYFSDFETYELLCDLGRKGAWAAMMEEIDSLALPPLPDSHHTLLAQLTTWMKAIGTFYTGDVDESATLFRSARLMRRMERCETALLFNEFVALRSIRIPSKPLELHTQASSLLATVQLLRMIRLDNAPQALAFVWSAFNGFEDVVSLEETEMGIRLFCTDLGRHGRSIEGLSHQESCQIVQRIQWAALCSLCLVLCGRVAPAMHCTRLLLRHTQTFERSMHSSIAQIHHSDHHCEDHDSSTSLPSRSWQHLRRLLMTLESVFSGDGGKSSFLHLPAEVMGMAFESAKTRYERQLYPPRGCVQDGHSTDLWCNALQQCILQYREQKRYHDATSLLKRLLDDKIPMSSRAQARIANLHAVLLMDSNRTDEAKLYFELCLTLRSNDIVSILNLALVHDHQGRRAEAREMLGMLLRSVMSDFNGQGDVWESWKWENEVIAHPFTALRVSSISSVTLHDHHLLLLGESVDAVATISPVSIAWELAWSAFRDGKWEEAETNIANMIQGFSLNYRHQQQGQEGLTMWGPFHRISFIGLLLVLTKCRIRQRKFKSAVKVIDNVLKICPHHIEFMALKAELLFESGKLKAALDVLLGGMEICHARVEDGQFEQTKTLIARIQNMMGVIHVCLGSQENAMRAFLRAIHENSDFLAASLNATLLLLLREDVVNAIRIWFKARKFKLSSSLAFFETVKMDALHAMAGLPSNVVESNTYDQPSRMQVLQMDVVCISQWLRMGDVKRKEVDEMERSEDLLLAIFQVG
eukprot:TRINITY_DN798_c0_g1_i1.p1 TRINITY_DN798_c0_g1~~TRINITY_DN798_c0_g1_i1.p1  ORF type:complete len:766 (+),score=196.17 TRINITY_DN798_c0_g1_i1:66-2363(+)